MCDTNISSYMTSTGSYHAGYTGRWDIQCYFFSNKRLFKFIVESCIFDEVLN